MKTRNINKKTGTEDNQILRLPVVLVPGKWSSVFKDYEYKIWVAQVLNQCVRINHLAITGYLLEQDRLYLLIEIEQENLDKMLQIFFENIQHGIFKYAEKLAQDGTPLSQDVLSEIPGNCNGLFKQAPLRDEFLVGLLTGSNNNVGSPDSAQQAATRRRVRNSLFCSAIDYAGGIGPVIVKLKK